MTVRERTKALTTKPGEKLRNALGLGLEHSGTCAQLARAMSQYRTMIRKRPDLWPVGRYCGEESTLRIRIEGLAGALGKGFRPIYRGDGTILIVALDGYPYSV